MKGHMIKDSFLTTCICWSALHWVVEHICRDSIERNVKKKAFWWVLVASCCFYRLRLIGRVSQFLLDRTVVANLLIVSVSGLNYHCWFLGTELLMSWQCRLDSPQRTLSKQLHTLLCPINLSFPLPLVGGRLEGRLRYLRTIIKCRLWKKLKLQALVAKLDDLSLIPRIYMLEEES